MADRQVNSPSHGGKFSKPNPRLIVIHSVEAPARAGLAYSLATGWMQTAGTSVHSLNDPGESVDMVALDTIAYHVGGGNSYGIGNEHTGYAAWDFKTWTSEPAFSALKVGAKKAAHQAAILGIPLRWLSVAQVRDGVSKGFCTHNDCRLAFGGTTHTDPGPGFPYAIFMQMVQQYASNAPVTGNQPTPTTKPTTNIPQVGGADSGDDMALTFFNFPNDDGTGSRVFLSDFVTFRHIKSMEELAFVIWSQARLGNKLKYVSDGDFTLSDVPAGDPKEAANVVANAKVSSNPDIYGVNVENLGK